VFLDCITVFGKNKTDKLQLNLSVFGAGDKNEKAKSKAYRL